jgi:hypothetical protein
MLEASSLEKLDGIVEGVESLMGRVQLSEQACSPLPSYKAEKQRIRLSDRSVVRWGRGSISSPKAKVEVETQPKGTSEPKGSVVDEPEYERNL